MDSFLRELSVKKVITVEDILLFKKYIAKKYKDYSSDYRSEILSNAVHQVLDKSIPAMDKKSIKTIKQKLLENCLAKDGQPVLLIDIFNVCISIENKPSNFYDNLINWGNSHAQNKITKTDIEKYNVDLYPFQLKDPVLIPMEKVFESSEDNNFIDVAVIEAVRTIYDVQRPVSYTQFETFTRFLSLKSIILSGGAKFFTAFLIISILFLSNQYVLIPTHFFEKPIGTQKLLNLQTLKYESFDGTAALNSYNPLESALPNNFKYKTINEISLKKYLMGRKSLLVEEPYFSTIIAASKKYNLNPLVLFAITGQEQGFVAKSSPASNMMANNPFNIYHSWKEYNTNIGDACQIVCVTIINLCMDRPFGENPFSWINKKYAQDQNWAKSVSSIYYSLERNNLMLLEP